MKSALADYPFATLYSGMWKGIQRDKSFKRPKSGLSQVSTTMVSDAGMERSIAAIDFSFPSKFVV